MMTEQSPYLNCEQNKGDDWRFQGNKVKSNTCSTFWMGDSTVKLFKRKDREVFTSTNCYESGDYGEKIKSRK